MLVSGFPCQSVCFFVSFNIIVATLQSVPLSHTLAHAHSLWRVPRPGSWNQLPVHIQARETVSSFDTTLKTHLHSVDQVQIVQAHSSLVMTLPCYGALEIVVVVIIIIITTVTIATTSCYLYYSYSRSPSPCCTRFCGTESFPIYGAGFLTCLMPIKSKTKSQSFT